MPPNSWRSNAAQAFVNGQITRIDGYWAPYLLSIDIFEFISEFDLWQAAFGNVAARARARWDELQAMHRGVTDATSAIRNIGWRITKTTERTVLDGLLSDLKDHVVNPLQKLHEAAPLTINFKAASWFGGQAGFDEYRTTWDRQTTDAALNVKPDLKNPPHVRAKADRWALYGQFGDGKTAVAASGLNLPHVKSQPGQASYRFSPNKVVTGAGHAQVFAALNYGRRKHGANTDYGESYFELDDGYKKAAIYFAMDTFTPVYDPGTTGAKSKANRSKLYQVSGNSFGGAILLAIKSQYEMNRNATWKKWSSDLATALLESARDTTKQQPDTKEASLMIEAHLFQNVFVKPGCVSKVWISENELDNAQDAQFQPIPRTTLVAALGAFTHRTGVRWQVIR